MQLRLCRMTAPVLHTQRFVLTEPREADASAVARICSDATIQRWTTVPSPYTESDAKAFIAANSGANWNPELPTFFVREQQDGDPIACVGLSSNGAGVPSPAIWVAPEQRGRGVVTEAVNRILDYAFDTLGLPAVRWSVEYSDGEPNWASLRVAWKLGFTFEGRQRAAQTNKGRVVDLFTASLRRDEPRRPQHAWFGPDPRHPAYGDARQPEALVRQFHEIYGLPIVTDGPNADRERIHLRLRLVAEEFSELVTASYGRAAGERIVAAFREAEQMDDHTRDTVEVADALGDLVYVIYGMALELGIPMRDVLAEIQASNLSKLGDDGKPIYREDGKVLKGSHYFRPDLRRVLGL